MLPSSGRGARDLHGDRARDSPGPPESSRRPATDVASASWGPDASSTRPTPGRCSSGSSSSPCSPS
eukprot:31027-Pelagococcus_subviridis.AAC.12